MAKTLIPWSTTSAAATSSWVESGLLAQSTRSAPPAFNAMARFAVSAVAWRQAAIRIPFSGFCFANRSRIWCTTGIDRPDHSMRPRPFSARARFFTSQGTGAEGFFRDASFLAGTAMCVSTSRKSAAASAPERGRLYARRGGGASTAPGNGRETTAQLLASRRPASSHPGVVAARLVPVAAGRHLAPAASSVLAGVQEHPSAPVHGRCLADPDSASLGTGEELGGGQCKVGNERVEARGFRRHPAVTLRRAHQSTLRPGPAHLALEELQRLGSRLSVLGSREEHSEKRLPEGAHSTERRARLGGPELDLHQHGMGSFLVQPPGLQAPGHEVLGSGEVLAWGDQPVPSQGVEEVE